MAKKGLPTPVTNPEKLAAKAAGMDIETPTPVTNMEKYLVAIAKGGGVSPGDAYTKAETDELLDGKADLVDGKVPAAQLPSYVDDVMEYASTSAFPATGESGKIYVASDTNKTYRWGGSAYVEISESLALGETASTAYAGNKGKANADAITAIKDGTTIDSFADVETALAGKANTSDLGVAAAKGFDASPTSGSTNNAVSSDGVANALVPITAELVELVDRGAKNACPWSGGTAATNNSYAVTNSPIIFPAGTYVLALKTTASDGRCEMSVKNSANAGIGSATIAMTSGYLSAEFTIAEDAAKFDLFSMRACTFSDVMICSKSAWDISHKFVPYCPSMAEMYAMIQALQT